MAQKVAIADGNWSTAGTWNSVTNTPTMHASTNITLSSTSGSFSATFTAPNTSNACVGVLLYVVTQPVTASYVITLQENSIDTAATVTISAANWPITGNWIFAKFPSAYTFTSTTAGYYRFKITRASATTNAAVAADSGGSNFAFLAVDNRTGAPATTDDVWLVGSNGTGTVSVTVDSTQTIGSGTNTTGLSQRSIGNAVTISTGGLLSWDTTASASLTSKGNATSSGGGELRMGTVASPYPASYTAQLIFNENGTGGNYGLESYVNGKVTLQGAVKGSTTLWKTTYVSGSGTTGSPMIVADTTGWAVNDEILVCAYSSNATNYNETENKFIKTISGTSITLSDTAGGAESALTYTHGTGAYILNVQRNVIIKSSTTTEGFYYYNANTTVGDVNIDWTRFETMGVSAANKTGIVLLSGSGITVSCDYSVAYRPLYRGFAFVGSKNNLSFAGLITCNQNSSTAVGGFDISGSANNKSFADCFAIKNNRVGFLISGANITLSRYVGISNNTAGNTASTSTGAVALSASTKILLDSCNLHCNRTMAMTLNGATQVSGVNCLIGSKGANGIDINILSDTFADTVFTNSTLSSVTLINNYLNLVTGSKIAFQTLNGATNANYWYTNTGIAQATGASLTDTTTRTAGALAVRLAPENSTDGFVWEFQILAKASSAVSIIGYAQENAAFGTDVCTIELLLPGSTTADATATLTSVTGTWQVFNLAANYTGTVSGLATVRVTAKSATAGAYVYFADFYNGSNVLTNLTTWYNGQPASIIYPELGDPAAVWAVLSSTLSTSGTVGYDILTTYLASISGRVPSTLVGGKMDSYLSSAATDAISAAAVSAGAVSKIQAGLSTLTAQQVWEYVTRTLTASSDPTAAAIASQLLSTTVDGRTFQNILLDVWAQVVGDFVADDADDPATIEYYNPGGAIQVTHTLTDTERTVS